MVYCVSPLSDRKGIQPVINSNLVALWSRLTEVMYSITCPEKCPKLCRFLVLLNLFQVGSLNMYMYYAV